MTFNTLVRYKFKHTNKLPKQNLLGNNVDKQHRAELDYVLFQYAYFIETV